MADVGKATFSVKVDTGPLVEMVQRAIDSIELLDRAVIIWRWEDAPEEYRVLLREESWEWVALVPRCFREITLFPVSHLHEYVIRELDSGDCVLAFDS